MKSDDVKPLRFNTLVHSLMSKQKGMAGMEENVRQGWRAGGRAPAGYILEHVPTGAIREGAPVMKSRLLPGPEAPQIAAYLRGRAAGRGRKALCDELGITHNGLHDLEWNALLYAGHTVWNMRAPRGCSSRRRPRSEWVIQRDMHSPLISEAEAEMLLSKLEEGRQSLRTPAVYLLTSLLQTPDSQHWHGNGGYYRVGKKNIRATRIEQSVIRQLTADLQSDEFVTRLTVEVRKLMNQQTPPDTAGWRREAAELDRKIERLTALLADVEEPRPLLQQIDSFERKRQEIETRLEQAAREAKRARTLHQIQEGDVRRALAGMAERLTDLDRERLKDYLGTVCERITLDPATLKCCIYYQISVETGDLVASPRGFEPLLPP